MSLPSITPEVLAAFEKALGKTSSTKEQRQLVKNLLLTAGGDQLKALKAQKNTNVITNVTSKSFFPRVNVLFRHRVVTLFNKDG